MMNFKEIKNHHELTQFYSENGLEAECDWAETMNPLRSIAVYDGDVLSGAATVSFRFGEYILDYIAVNEASRRSGIGGKLFAEIFPGGTMYLTARVPAFFYSIGCVDAPDADFLIKECAGCPQKNISCFPKALKYSEENK